MVSTVRTVVVTGPPPACSSGAGAQDAEQALLQADPPRLDGVHPGTEARPGRDQVGHGGPVVVGGQRHGEPVAVALGLPRGASRASAGGDRSVSCSRSSRWPSSSARVPDAATRPRSRMTTRSQTRSTSPIRCELSSTATPRLRRSSTMSRTSTRPSGSSALVGSSSTTSSGRATRATASPRRCCMPLEKPPTRSPARSARPTSARHSRCSAARHVEPRQPDVQRQHLGRRVSHGW